MRVGSVKDEQSGRIKRVRHLWMPNFYNKRLYHTHCGSTSRHQKNIDFSSDGPPCQRCVALHLRDHARAVKALKLLGVEV